MTSLVKDIDARTTVSLEIDDLLGKLGHGVVEAVPYDTAWAARLESRYPGSGFEDSIEWLRRNQREDGTWGAPLLHYHDRFISTLAAIVALRELSRNAHDEHQVRRGEAALWKMASYLGRDDSDTVGFPVVSASLAQDATALGLDVPRAPVRYADGYRKKVNHILSLSNRDWRSSALSFSLEGLWREVSPNDRVLEANASVASSPAATAAYLFSHYDAGAVKYLRQIKDDEGGLPALAPIDVFDISWSLSQLWHLSAVQPDHPEVRRMLEHLWARWSTETGLYYSTYFRVPDLDITSASYVLLRWGGYPVQADIFEYFEMDDHFCTYRHESNPSPAAHLRLLLTLQWCPEHPKQPGWVQKVVSALHRYDENGSFWWDKWHVSPYYVSHLAIRALVNVDTALASTRLKWIARTQNADGGWGYLGGSTVEETAYCLDALLFWSRNVEPVDQQMIERGAGFLMAHLDSQNYTPLWISKGLYTPRNIVRSAVLSALFQYLEQH